MMPSQHFAEWWSLWGDTVRFWKVKSVANAAYRDGYAQGIEARQRQDAKRLDPKDESAVANGGAPKEKS